MLAVFMVAIDASMPQRMWQSAPNESALKLSRQLTCPQAALFAIQRNVVERPNVLILKNSNPKYQFLLTD
jgi:hypothetical protein